jgi:hypothetical protein
MKKNLMNQKFEPGTIGREAQKLVKRFGGYVAGITILEFALMAATETESVIFRNDDGTKQHLTETSGWKKADARETEILARLDAEKAKAAMPEGVAS